MTAGQRWRFRRNLAIAVLFRAGFSQRFLADVFDLPRSHVAAIIREVTEGAPETDRGPKALDRPAFRGWVQGTLLKSRQVGRKRLERQ